MSPANVKYILNHNPEVDSSKVEVCPNAIEVKDKSIDDESRIAIRNKYGIPLDKTVFVYGGNLGKPQGIPFLIDCLRAQHNEDAFFLIVGDGTEYGKLEAFIEEERPFNVMLMKKLPKEDYDTMVAACDVGMIFLDHRFTIPNFPSRILSYMQAKLPVLAVTDPNTDIGEIITDGGFGWWINDNSIIHFKNIIAEAIAGKELLNNSYEYLLLKYDVSKAYNIIMSQKG